MLLSRDLLHRIRRRRLPGSTHGRVNVLLLCLIYLSLAKSLARATCSTALPGKAVILGAHLGKPVENAVLHAGFTV